MLTQKIRDDMKQAMLAKDAIKLNSLRGLLAAFTNELVAKKRKPTEELSDDEALAVIARAVKQRKDSIEQFKKGNREDLVANEEAELAVISVYMPAQMSKEEIEVVVKNKASELGVTDKTGANKLMGIVMKELKGQADGNEVKTVIDAMFS
ncbi:MAG: hypothetical protein A3E93_02975 [Candidatus Zambryskibacteria bacterium RIFCSPHIGHO2_12_FULL_43_12b]|uniref:Glutamyl-tRNA amidotransferase n=1 Tax=Candidatus Zambryskibacteria bacterium RIFCSPLOWO2_01_FULL_43_17 TaxID=1802760 RepID=A0A1G2U0B8_9BACT|nr:MAG: hypothetical protein A3E93_02975 [Candidatus Zambryskibacteria bacterium RIFCSPHIGHO2_12_FULL_43_12b]OHB02985.1 MAG: hypothetical protein A2920_02840 [Candidatus Zambryskibacteria bacterium RIFCSPLOWO2_01_FULL_43_17]